MRFIALVLAAAAAFASLPASASPANSAAAAKPRFVGPGQPDYKDLCAFIQDHADRSPCPVPATAFD